MDKTEYYIRTDKNEMFKVEERLFDYIVKLEQQVKKQKDPTSEGLYEIFEIQNGNKKIIIEYIKAIRNIMNKALEELEGSDN